MENLKLSSKKKEKLTGKNLIIDGSNVFHALGETGFNSLIADIRKYDPKMILIFADANLPHIANMKKISKLESVHCVPAGIEADNFIIQAVNRYENVVLISNDLFREYDQSLLVDADILRFMMIQSDLYYSLDLNKKGKCDRKPKRKKNVDKNMDNPQLKKKIDEKSIQFPVLDKIFAQKGELNLYPEVEQQ